MKYIGPGQKVIPFKTQMSSKPLDLKLQNKFRTLVVVAFFVNFPTYLFMFVH